MKIACLQLVKAHPATTSLFPMLMERPLVCLQYSVGLAAYQELQVVGDNNFGLLHAWAMRFRQY
eukprot:3162790-Amphidinium_carterae.1